MTNEETMTDAAIAALFNTGFSDIKSHERERVPFLDRISLVKPKTEWKEKKGVEPGDWLLTPGKKAEEGQPTAYENLGKAFQCTILHSSVQLALIDDDEDGHKRTFMESSEFQGNNDPIFLMDARNGPLHIVAVAPYSLGSALETIKNVKNRPGMPTKKSKDGKEEYSALDFRYNVYVMLSDGRVCLLSNTKRGHFGTDPDTGETRSFKNVSADSYIRARATCHEKTPGLTLSCRMLVSSVPVGGPEDEPRPSFQVLGLQTDPSIVPTLREKTDWLKSHLEQKWADKIGYAWNNTSQAQREHLVTAYAGIRPMLDAIGGHEAASKIALGRDSAPSLLSEPEPDFDALEAARKPGEQAAIAALANELETDAATPPGVIDAQIVDPAKFKGTGPEISVEDLPF